MNSLILIVSIIGLASVQAIIRIMCEGKSERFIYNIGYLAGVATAIILQLVL